MDLLTQLGITLLAWLLVAGPVLAVATLLWFTLPAQHRQLLPPQRHYLAPWSGWETFLVFLGLGIWQPLMIQLLINTLGKPDKPDELLYAYVAYALAFPVFIGISLLLLNRASGTQLYQLGIHLSRWRQGVLLACIVWLVATPLIYVLHFGVEWLYLQWMEKPPESHELVQLIDQAANPVLSWTLVLLAALIIGPVLEEFIFRGVIQPWAGKYAWGSHMVWLLAFLGILLRNAENSSKNADITQETIGLVTFLLLLTPIYHFCPLFVGWALSIPNRGKNNAQTDNTAREIQVNYWQKNREAVDNRRRLPGGWVLNQVDALFNPARQDPRVTKPRAIFATAALFASIHPWPTPIPLFLLGLLLGWVAYRTQSLVAPVILHFLFNAVACITVALAL